MSLFIISSLLRSIVNHGITRSEADISRFSNRDEIVAGMLLVIVQGVKANGCRTVNVASAHYWFLADTVSSVVVLEGNCTQLVLDALHRS
jgi:hypothetical protein